MEASWLNTLVTGGNPLRDSGYLAVVLDRLSHHALGLLAVDACAILVRDPSEPRMGIVVAASGWEHEVVGTRFAFASDGRGDGDGIRSRDGGARRRPAMADDR